MSILLSCRSPRKQPSAIDLFDEAALFLNRHVAVAGWFEEGKWERRDRPQYPFRTLREAIVNALCHRDYSMPGGAISIAMYDDRLEIINPGPLPSGITLAELAKKSAKQQKERLFEVKLIPAKSGSGALFDVSFGDDDSGPVECLGMTFENDASRREHFLKLLREKLHDPEFRKIEGFPIGDDDDILAMSDPPYYTACPNPFVATFVSADEASNLGYRKEPFASDVSEGKNDATYNAHAYHTKVPHKAIIHYLLHYTEPGDSPCQLDWQDRKFRRLRREPARRPSFPSPAADGGGGREAWPRLGPLSFLACQTRPLSRVRGLAGVLSGANASRIRSD